MRIVLLVLLALLIAGCASPYLWGTKHAFVAEYTADHVHWDYGTYRHLGW